VGKKQVSRCIFSRSQENYLEKMSPDKRQVKCCLLSDILGIFYLGVSRSIRDEKLGYKG
jgi:hypothetical protein